MKEFGSGAFGKPRIPRSIEAASLIDPVDSKCASPSQGARGRVRTSGPSLREARSAELRRLRRLRRVQTIAGMRAPRLWFEMFEQPARDLGADDYIDALLERFAGLDADVLRVLDADKLPASPIHAVRGAR
jgi:hypothetical protein